MIFHLDSYVLVLKKEEKHKIKTKVRCKKGNHHATKNKLFHLSAYIHENVCKLKRDQEEGKGFSFVGRGGNKPGAHARSGEPPRCPHERFILIQQHIQQVSLSELMTSWPHILPVPLPPRSGGPDRGVKRVCGSVST